MGIDLGSIYFEFGEPVKTMGVYNEVELNFKKKIAEHRTSSFHRKNGDAFRNYVVVKQSTNPERHIMIDMLDNDATIDAYAIKRRKKLEGTKGWTVTAKTSFKNSTFPKTKYYYIPYMIKEVKTIELFYVKPVEQNPKIDALIMKARSKSLHRAIMEFEENLGREVIHRVDVDDIPRTCLESAKKPKHIVNEYMLTLLAPIPEYTLSKFDEALEQTLRILTQHERNISSLNFGTDGLFIKKERRVGEDASVLDALKAIVAEVKRRKQTAIIDTSW